MPESRSGAEARHSRSRLVSPPSQERRGGVQGVMLRLCCRYLVTFSPLMDTQDDPQAIIIWDILTGQKKRGFHCESSAHWPIFK